MDIINKTYKRKNAIESDLFTVSSIDNDFVIFDNNAKCKLSTFLIEFEETLSNNKLIDDSVIDPDTFFSSPLVDDVLLEQLETVHKNPNTHIPPSKIVEESKPIHNEERPIYNKLSEIQEKKQEVRLPEWDVFDNVKIAEEIEILIPVKIKLPKAEKIDILNDMFKTSFTSYIAKKYINTNIINNSSQL